MDKLTIRTAAAEDAEIIAGFQLNMALETEQTRLDPVVVQAGVQAVLEDPAKGVYYVAEYPAEIVASLMITTEWSDWRNGRVWWIQSVYVKPKARNKGIYTRMYAFIQEVVNASPETKGIRLYVDQNNHSACEVYSRLGMNGDHYRVYEWMKEF